MGPAFALQISLMGKALGSQIGEVLESAVYELPDKAKFVKIKILFDISNPIRAGIHRKRG